MVSKSPVHLLKDLLSFAIGLIEVLLVLRFVLKLLAASPRSEFVAWIYDTSNSFLQPFTFVFPNPSVRGGFTLEFTTLFAIFAYFFIGYIVQELLDLIGGRHK